MSRLWFVDSPDAPPVRAPYSLAVGAAAPFLFLSGQGPFTAVGDLVEGPFAAQARQAFRNVITLVEAAGATVSDIVRVGVYLRDMTRDFAELNAIYREFFQDPLPARTTIPCPLPRFDIEVDAVVSLAHSTAAGEALG